MLLGALLALLLGTRSYQEQRASLLEARTLLGAPGLTTRNEKLLGTKGIATRSKDATRGAPRLTTRNKKLLGTKGIATRSKEATRGSWPYH